MKYASDFRAHARASLANHWWLAVGISFLAGLLGAEASYSGYSPFTYRYNYDEMESFFNSETFNIMLPFFIAIGGFVLVLGIGQFIIGGAIQLGYNRFCLDLVDQKESSINRLFSAFSILWKALGLRLVIGIFTFLWTMLFIIPGIIAAYRYSQATMIMAENPEIGIMEAINRSKEMMVGNKWRLFCLQISFIGWSIACIFTCGIGYLWLTPYSKVATAAFYREVSGTWFNPNYDQNNTNQFQTDYNNNNYYNNNSSIY